MNAIDLMAWWVLNRWPQDCPLMRVTGAQLNALVQMALAVAHTTDPFGPHASAGRTAWRLVDYYQGPAQYARYLDPARMSRGAMQLSHRNLWVQVALALRPAARPRPCSAGATCTPGAPSDRIA